jgi:L-rhamnose mutarotase
MRSGKAEICRTAYVAQVPAENEAAVRAQCLNLEVSGAIERRGCYLREIDSRLYLFQYLEKNSPSDLVNFQGLEKLVKPLPVATGNGRAFESMERIFYEPGTADKTPEGDVKRIAMFTELKRDKEAHYRLLHANPWPDVIAAIKKANFRHFSIFLEEINGKVYLFGWLEYVGNDISADDAINKQNPASIRWWKETDACQIAPDDAGGGMWGGMKELFFAE